MLDGVSFQLFAMPGDPAILEVTPATLSATNLLNAVAVKLPRFWPEKMEMWFVQYESQFLLKEVTVRKTMFDYCVARGRRQGSRPHQEPSH